VHRLSARRRVLLKLERELWARGLTKVCGVDEVGVGPLAGPLVAAAVILPPEVPLRGVDDSKKLTAGARATVVRAIRETAIAFSIGVVSAAEVDRLNTFGGALEAMRRAVVGLPVEPDQLLVDARTIPGVRAPQQALIKGDSRSYSIAAASILAKEYRDDWMRRMDRAYPEYGFGRHMGYGTRAHLAALDKYGPCPEHRRSFAPVRQTRLPFVD
jgi:ribonuclease HII